MLVDTKYGQDYLLGRLSAIRADAMAIISLVDSAYWQVVHETETLSPEHPGNTVKREMDGRGWSYHTMAQLTGIVPSQWHRLAKGKTKIDIRSAYGLEKAFGVDARVWMTLQMNYDIAKEGIES